MYGIKTVQQVLRGLQDLQDTVSRLAAHKGVQVVVILNRQGDIVAQSGASAAQQAKSIHKLLEVARAYLHTLAEEDEVSFLSLRSSQHREIMISPHEGYVLAVVKA